MPLSFLSLITAILTHTIIPRKIRVKLPDVIPRAIPAEGIQLLVESATTVRDKDLILQAPYLLCDYCATGKPDLFPFFYWHKPQEMHIGLNDNLFNTLQGNSWRRDWHVVMFDCCSRWTPSA